MAYILDYGLKRTELFGIIKKRQLLKTGPLFVGTDYEKSLEKGGEFFIECFNYIKDNTKDQWDKGEAKGGFVARNIGIASIVLIIADIMDFYPDFFKGVYPKGNLSWHHLWFLPYLLFYSIFFTPLFIYLRRINNSGFFKF